MVLRNLRQASSHIQHFKQIAVSQEDFEEVLFDLRTYLDEVITFLKIEHSHHDIHLHCPDNIEITSCPGIFLHILSHLVANSVQHGFEQAKPGTITITITRETDDLLVHYHDNGKGMPSGVLEKMFDPFFTTKRGTGGNGLGMYIVYNLVTQKLKGQITCESVQGHGSSFTITMPI